MSSTEIRLTWKPVEARHINGIIRGYVVYTREGLSPNATVKNVTIKVQNHSGRRRRAIVDGSLDLPLKDLKKHTWYRFQILAFTIKDGVLSPEIVVRTAEGGELRNCIAYGIHAPFEYYINVKSSNVVCVDTLVTKMV